MSVGSGSLWPRRYAAFFGWDALIALHLRLELVAEELTEERGGFMWFQAVAHRVGLSTPPEESLQACLAAALKRLCRKSIVDGKANPADACLHEEMTVSLENPGILLMQAALERSSEAWALLVHRLRCLRKWRAGPSADEVAGWLFLHIDRLRSYDGRGHWDAWLARVVPPVCTSPARAHSLVDSERLTSQERGPDEVLEIVELHTDLEKALAHLREPEARAVRLRGSGASFAEIATDLSLRDRKAAFRLWNRGSRSLRFHLRQKGHA